jgi:ribosomal-protein-alanine N-acetyltransferase
MTTIKGTRFTLRPYTMADEMTLITQINQPAIARDTVIDIPWVCQHGGWWISFITEAAKKRPVSEVHFVIDIDGAFAGTVAIINIDGHKGEIGYWLADGFSGQGLMTEAVGMVCDYVFKKMPLVRLFAPVLTHNEASANVLKKNGFTHEGTFKKYYRKKGKYIDAWAYAKFK